MKKISLLLFLGLIFNTSYAADGVINVKSKYGVPHTADRFIGIVKKKGMKVMAHVKHSQGAKNVGIAMNPTELVIFGNPKLGSPLMVCQPSFAIDLPQKMLVWEDNSGQVWLSYNDPVYIADRHHLKQECRSSLKKIAGALSKLSHKAGGMD
jgi:uncharacterized protein (DUF302 family)